ncbi:MAG: FecR family protein [Ottowia sp.]|uniref:FecR family protein n=1 Tax=Ottowia sp. TaxID=1898956 RepID=UPI0039E4780B
MTFSISRAALALLCAWQLGATAALAQGADAGDQRDGTIKTVQGDVTVVRGDARAAAIVGGPLRATDRIQTGADSAVAIVLKDGSVLSVGPGSVVDLSDFSFDTTTQEGGMLVNVLRGTVRLATGLIAKLKPEQVKVTTPTTVIGVRGTDFIVEENP